MGGVGTVEERKTYCVYYIYTRCPNGEFRLCCLYSPLRPSLSLLSHPLAFPPLLSPPSFPILFSLLPPLPFSLSLFQSPSLNLRSFYCFCLSAFLCVIERESV